MSKTIEQLAKEHLKSTKSNGLAITYSLDELEDFAKAYQAQNEQQEVVGFIDEADDGIFGDVQKGIAEGLCKVGDLLYTSPKQIPDGWKLIGKVSEIGVVWYKQNPHAHPIGTEFYAVLPTTSLTSETNTEVVE